MKNNLLKIGLIGASLFALSGCANETHYETKDYFLEMSYKEDFKILQLCDIHLSNKDDLQHQFDFMSLTINDAHSDLIVLCGDMFTFANKSTVKDFFSFMDSFNTPWTCCFGNHDEQGYFSISWLTSYLNDLTNSSDSYCLFKDNHNDDVFGNCNFVINLKDGNDVKEQIIIMDSNRYSYGITSGYDYIKENQIQWYKDVVDYSTANYSDGVNVIPSLLFFHIPLPEFNDAWEYQKSHPEALLMGEKREASCPPDYNSGFFDVIKDKGSTKAINVAHDHVNDFTILYEGIYFSYGVTSTDRIYADNDMMGGKLITLHGDEILFTHIFHTYKEVE